MNWLEYLNEMAFSLPKLEDKITGLSEPVVLHIIKLLAFKDERNFKKHSVAVDNWLLQIEAYVPKVKRKSLPVRYSKWIITDWLGDVKKVEKTIQRRLTDYYGLPRTKFSVEQIHTIIKDAAERIGRDVALEKYTTISSYINFKQ